MKKLIIVIAVMVAMVLSLLALTGCEKEEDKMSITFELSSKTTDYSSKEVADERTNLLRVVTSFDDLTQL